MNVELELGMIERGVRACFGGFKRYKDSILTADENDLLLEVLKWHNPEYHLANALLIRRTDQAGEFLTIGKKNFYEDNNPAFRVRYLEAFERLCERGMIRHEQGRVFVLSVAGMEAAQKLPGS
jgi:hypothetical protein